jgi:hypothetical protein
MTIPVYSNKKIRKNPCKNPSFDINGLTLSYDEHSVITVTGPFERLPEGQHIRSYFGRSQPGSDWGADGIGYYVQQKAGRFSIHRSGVGPKKFKQGLQQLVSEGKIKSSYSQNPEGMKEINIVGIVDIALLHYDSAEKLIAENDISMALINYSAAASIINIACDIGKGIIPVETYKKLRSKVGEITNKMCTLVKIEDAQRRIKLDGYSRQNPCPTRRKRK